MPSHETIIQQIRERVDYAALFAELLPNLRGRGAWRDAFCVFHENTDTPALGVNVQEGFYVCRNPACAARGDFIDLYMRLRQLSFREAVSELARRVGLELTTPTETGRGGGETGVIDELVVDNAHARLLASPTLLAQLAERRGWTEATVRTWKLGHDGQRFYIPIRDEVGRVVNIRRYKPDAGAHEDKMISWRPGYGTARLWPFDSIERAATTGEPLFLFEGEPDALLALQMGFAALTTTGGSGTWRDAWLPLFRGRDVVLCYDADAAGRTGARGVAARLAGVARRLRLLELPLTAPDKDFTDYIVRRGHTGADFMGLVAQTSELSAEAASAPPPAEPDPAPRSPNAPPSLDVPDDEGVVALHLSQASRSEFYNQRIRVPVMVSGKTTAPYLVPRKVRMACDMPALKMCERCPVARAAGNLDHELTFGTNDVLQFTNVQDTKVQTLLKAKVGIPSRCTYVDAEVRESQNVEEIQIIPEIDRSGEDAPYVTRVAFYLGHGLTSNRSYVMTGVTVPTPDRQLATHLITDAVPAQSNIDAFRLSEDVVTRLRAFQPPEGARASSADLWRHLDALYDDIERVTRIWARRDLMLAADLVFHSVLTFDFQGERLARGWTEALVLGDSRTGKTTIVQRLITHYRAGELTSGENATLAGLVGGLHQIGNSWALQWGRIPLNDRRLLAVDEAGTLPQEPVGRLSSIRSSGVAEIVKVHTERTNARTRQVWISNPRGNRPLSSYGQGVLAVKELIGAPEDIARFDLVVTAASGDVPLAAINARRPVLPPATFTTDLCHQRVMWAWSRRPEQVQWAEGAETRVLAHAQRHGEQYQFATEIPLVEPNEQRVKLARLAVAVAATFFSTDAAGEAVVVRAAHADLAAEFLDRLYGKPSLAFDEYATNATRRFSIRDAEAVRRVVARTADAAQQLMEQEQLTQSDLQEVLAYSERSELREAVTTLRENGFLRRVGSSYYVKTPAAIRFLREYLAGGAAAYASRERVGALSAPSPNGAHPAPRVPAGALPDVEDDEDPPF
jgi:hypothetical protein